MVKTPQEIVVWYVLPAIRRELALELKRTGKSQKEISEILDITKAAVSQYLKNKRGNDVQFGKEILDKIKQSASNILRNPDDLFGEYKIIINMVQKTKLLCKLHKKYGHEKENCRACFVVNV